MAEFIGSRISLISKRDIRYVGTLHEINSENSTVALENVVSFGTEGRRPEDEVVPSDNVYEYIVFRGSDVKDLRIEENPKKDTTPKPPVPDDPAILGSARRPSHSSAPSVPSQQQANFQGQPVQAQPSQSQIQQPQQPSQLPQPQHSQPAQQMTQQQQRQQPPRYPQQPFPTYYYPPTPNPRFGPQGFPPNMGFPGMQYGAPPGWYPPGQGFPYPPQGQLPSQFYAPQPPIGSTAQQQAQPGPQGPQSKQAVPTATATADLKEEPIASQQEDPEKPVATVKLPSTSTTPAPVYPVKQPTPPPPPTDSKPDVAAALAPPAATARKEDHASNKPTPIGPKSGRIMPAVPRLSPAKKTLLPVNGTQQPKPVTTTSENEKPITKIEPPRPSQTAKKSLEDANRDARAAVAAAMAKLSPAPGQKKQQDNDNIVDNLAKKVNEMRTNDNIRNSRQAGSGGNAAGHRGGRGGYRGGRSQDQQNHRVEVPATDYDFVSANAKFNKQDLVKEAIATGSAIGSPIEGAATKENSAASSINGTRNGNQPTMSIPSTAIYNKTSSFFDNISSESKDRDDGNVKKLGGREFRSEEQKKNLETFGQGSVDNGYRGGPGSRGRGRGRGYGRGRGGYTRGRGGYRGRGGNGTVATES